MTQTTNIILIIDKSDSDRRIYRRYLSLIRPDCRVEEAKNGKDGIEASSRLNPGCIILDFRLPDFDGLQALQKIREITDCPVIFISGNPDPFTITNAFRNGANTYLSKGTLDSEILREAMDSALGKN